MFYEINAYKPNEDDWSSHICWESSKSLDDIPNICDKLVSYVKPDETTYRVPEGITALNALCFIDEDLDIFDCDATVLELPASLTHIDDGAFLFTNFQTIIIAPDNTSFIVKEGGLYTADGKRLILILASNVEDAVFEVLEGTEQIDDTALFWDGIISIPNSVKNITVQPDYSMNPHLYIHMSENLNSFQKLLVHKGSYAENFAKKEEYTYEVIDE